MSLNTVTVYAGVMEKSECVLEILQTQDLQKPKRRSQSGKTYSGSL